MATAFIQTSIFTKTFVLTSEARSIAATTDEDRLSVSLTCSGVTFFTVDLYACDGKVELFDPGALIENYFIAHQMICGSITVIFGTVSHNILFLYCENEMSGSFNPSTVPLLSSSARRVHIDSQFTFAAIPVATNTPFIFKAVGHDSLGNISGVRFQVARALTDSIYTTFSVAQIISKATGHDIPGFGELMGDAVSDVMYFSSNMADGS